MKNLKIRFAYLSFCLLAISGCKTDVDIMAPYQEKAIIFGLLDPAATIQYIKVNRLFSGKGDANKFAQIPDSFNYNPADIEVSLQRIKAKETFTPFILKDTIVDGAVSGVFSTQKNIVYYTREILFSDSQYKLKVHNKRTGYEAEATTNVIDKITFSGTSSNSIIDFYKLGDFSNPRIIWNPKKNAEIYQLTMRFYYKEINSSDPSDITYKSLDWVFNTIDKSNLNSQGYVETLIKGEDFYSYLKSKKETNFNTPNVIRKAGSNLNLNDTARVEFTVTAIGEDYNIYRNLNSPSNSTYQEKPIYTNVKNGLGILSCRTTSNILVRFLGSETRKGLKESKYTDDLNFIFP